MGSDPSEKYLGQLKPREEPQVRYSSSLGFFASVRYESSVLLIRRRADRIDSQKIAGLPDVISREIVRLKGNLRRIGEPGRLIERRILLECGRSVVRAQL